MWILIFIIIILNKRKFFYQKIILNSLFCYRVEYHFFYVNVKMQNNFYFQMV